MSEEVTGPNKKGGKGETEKGAIIRNPIDPLPVTRHKAAISLKQAWW